MRSERRSSSDKVFDTVNLILLVIITIVTLYPLYFTVIASFSDPYEVAKGNVIFWLKGFTIEPYTNVFINDDIWIGYRNTIFTTVITVIYNLVLTIPAAYVMSRKGLKGKGILMAYFVFTMYFGGGLIPSYLLIKQLGLMNSLGALIIPAGFSV